MKIRKVTLGMMLFGNAIYFKYIAYVQEEKNKVIFIPLGRKINYMINSISYSTYQILPVIVYHSFENLEIRDENVFKDLLKYFELQLRILGFKIYQQDGIRIEYINQESLIGWNGTSIPLINGETPKQDHLRALIDVSDQLGRYYPRATTKITFLIKNKNKEIPFYIEQKTVYFKFKYINNFIIFFNNNTGFFKYNIITGEISGTLTDDLKKYLKKLWKLNYPNLTSAISISILSLEVDINFRSIIYN